MNIRKRGYCRLEERFEFNLHHNVWFKLLEWDYSYQVFKVSNQEYLKERKRRK